MDDDNYKWFGTEFGISKFRDENWQTYLAELPLADFVLDMFVDDQIILVGSLAGVSMINGDQIIDYNMDDGLIYDRVDAIAQDKDGVCGLQPIWCVGLDGVTGKVYCG